MCIDKSPHLSFTFTFTLLHYTVTGYTDTIRRPPAQSPKAVCIHRIHFPCVYPSHSTFYCRICTNILGFDWYYGSKLSGKWNIIAVSMKKASIMRVKLGRYLWCSALFTMPGVYMTDREWITDENPSQKLADKVLFEFGLFYSNYSYSNRCPFCMDWTYADYRNRTKMYFAFITNCVDLCTDV